MTRDEYDDRVARLRNPAILALFRRNIPRRHDPDGVVLEYLRRLQLPDTSLVRLMEGHVRLGGAMVLDVGCGSGFEACALAASGATVVGMDIEWERLEVAKLVAEERGVKVAWIRGDATETPFAMGSFDAVVCAHLIEHVEAPDRFLRKLASLLRDGGTLYLDYPSRWHPRQLLRDEHYGLPLVTALPRPVAAFIVTRVFKYEKNYSTNVFLSHRRVVKALEGLDVEWKQVLPDPRHVARLIEEPSRVLGEIARLVLHLLHALGLRRAMVRAVLRSRFPDLVSPNVGLLITKKRPA